MPTGDVQEIDRDALRAKYRAERDKRLRPDGNEQYVEPVGHLSHYLEDPYAEPEPPD
jgi:cyclohexanone monooxygenase